jgi:hypothetical protein
VSSSVPQSRTAWESIPAEEHSQRESKGASRPSNQERAKFFPAVNNPGPSVPECRFARPGLTTRPRSFQGTHPLFPPVRCAGSANWSPANWSPANWSPANGSPASPKQGRSRTNPPKGPRSPGDQPTQERNPDRTEPPAHETLHSVRLV